MWALFNKHYSNMYICENGNVCNALFFFCKLLPLYKKFTKSLSYMKLANFLRKEIRA